MKTTKTVIATSMERHYPSGVSTLLSCGLICVFMLTAATSARSQTTAAKPIVFDTAQKAADALVAALEKYDEVALKEILGPDSYDIVHTGEPERDRNSAKEFAEQARTKMSVSTDPKFRGRAFLLVGNDDWPTPVPIVKQGKGWSFDTQAGRQEILYRRIGGNELDAIAICRGYVEAQKEYASTKHGDAKVNQYAQRILSTPGKQDGLAWQSADGTWGGSIGETLAKALDRDSVEKPGPFHGYNFKVLKG